LLFSVGSAILPTIKDVEAVSVSTLYRWYTPKISAMQAHTSLIVFFGELRKSIRALGVGVLAVTLIIFFLSPRLLDIVQGHLAHKLYFFSIAGPFLAHVKLSLFAALYGLMPWITIVLWRAMARPFGVKGMPLAFFIFFTCLLFYAGTLFCYMITLPMGIEFLLGYGSEQLKPVISVTRFVNFTSIFILGFGLVFELPIFMVFMARVGVFSRRLYEKNRRYAILVIAIVAAILTPTPDVFNMALMGVPLYMLYEAGIIILVVMRIK
jgi:sec-independent protein translocase protein TatC